MLRLYSICARFLAATVATILPALPVAAAIPTAERDALIALYIATNGAGWHDRTGWRNTTDTGFNDPGTECSWYGVGCDSGGTTVQRLWLDNNNLSGSIPAEIAGLTGLQSLWLNLNQLDGVIPAQIGSLAALELLDLSNNFLDGPIPAEIGGLTSLEYLDLSINQTMGGEIPVQLWSLTNLRRLDLAWNLLDGVIPPDVENLVLLEYLDLGLNQLAGTIPEEIGKLPDLQHLGLARNELHGAIPEEIGNLANLVELFLGGNQLVGQIPEEIGDLSKLEYLHLGDNRLIGAIPEETGDLVSLQTLNLESNELEGPIPEAIGNLTNLQHLVLDENHLSGPLPAAIGSLTSLQSLRLAANRIAGEIPTELGDLDALVAGGLDLSYNGLFTNDPTLADFLSSKQIVWYVTQTVAPEGLGVTAVGDRTIWLAWTAVSYTAASGYEVLSAEVPEGMIVSGGCTPSREVTSFPVTGLQPGHIYDLAVRTFTNPHYNNDNTVVSERSPRVMATTSDLGCTAPEVEVEKDIGGFTLWVTSDHDSHEWSTGETTTSILVNPPVPTWYWLRTAGPGSCDEATVVLADPAVIFADGFESGGLARWPVVPSL